MKIDLLLIILVIAVLCLFSTNKETKELKREIETLKTSQPIEYEYKIVNGEWKNVPVLKENKER